MLIPQGLAYATLAGLPPLYGLYTAVIGLLAYPLFGSSPHLAVGPTAMQSLLVAGALASFDDAHCEAGDFASASCDRYTQLAMTMSFLVGERRCSRPAARARLPRQVSWMQVRGGSRFSSAAALSGRQRSGFLALLASRPVPLYCGHRLGCVHHMAGVFAQSWLPE